MRAEVNIKVSLPREMLKCGNKYSISDLNVCSEGHQSRWNGRGMASGTNMSSYHQIASLLDLEHRLQIASMS